MLALRPNASSRSCNPYRFHKQKSDIGGISCNDLLGDGVGLTVSGEVFLSLCRLKGLFVLQSGGIWIENESDAEDRMSSLWILCADTGAPRFVLNTFKLLKCRTTSLQ